MNKKNEIDLLINKLIKNKKNKYEGSIGLENKIKIFNELNNPQNKLKIIHIAGTSGKGSTCHTLSSLLVSHGFKVGLFTSPHVININERIKINNKDINNTDLYNLLIKFKEIIINNNCGYFEILTIIAYYYFHINKVDYAIIETGIGGKFDSTNVINNDNKLSIITRIGFDHKKILGNTLKEISLQKAGIINRNSVVICLKQKDIINKTISKYARSKNAKLLFVDYNKEKFKYNLNLKGKHQKENALLAEKSLKYLSQRDKFNIKENLIKNVFKSIKIIGRFDEIKNKNGEVKYILDGAHNPQKIRALIKTLNENYNNNKFIFIIKFNTIDNLKNSLKYFIKYNTDIYIESSNKDKYYINTFNKLNFNKYSFFNDLNILIKILNKNNHIKVITGSFYILDQAYNVIRKSI